MVDKISYDFVKGASVDYVEELIRSAFQVSHHFQKIDILSVVLTYS